jgi:hypothetical protein
VDHNYKVKANAVANGKIGGRIEHCVTSALKEFVASI